MTNTIGHVYKTIEEHTIVHTFGTTLQLLRNILDTIYQAARIFGGAFLAELCYDIRFMESVSYDRDCAIGLGGGRWCETFSIEEKYPTAKYATSGDMGKVSLELDMGMTPGMLMKFCNSIFGDRYSLVFVERILEGRITLKEKYSSKITQMKDYVAQLYHMGLCMLCNKLGVIYLGDLKDVATVVITTPTFWDKKIAAEKEGLFQGMTEKYDSLIENGYLRWHCYYILLANYSIFTEEEKYKDAILSEQCGLSGNLQYLERFPESRHDDFDY